MGESLEHRQHSFGRPFRLLLDARDPESNSHIAAVVDELARLEARFCSFSEGSFVHSLNQRAGSGVYTPLSSSARSLLDYVAALRQNSNRRYDPTTCLLNRFYSSSSHDESAAAAQLPLLGWDQLELTNEGARLPHKGMRIDLNNVVRPFAVDRLHALLQQRGVSSAMVDFDRDVATLGRKPDGSNWMPGLRYPRGDSGAIGKIKLNDRALAVRGDFERCLHRGETCLARAFDPATALPINALLTVAVIAGHALEASGAASIARLMEEAEALQWLEALGMPWLAIDAQRHCHGPIAGDLGLLRA